MGRLITWGYLEPLEKGALCLHTHMYTHTHTHTKSLLTPNFALSPNFREGAEVNTSTIKAFFEQNRSIILWVSRVQILISLNSASSPLRRERNGKKLQEPVFRNRTFHLFENWCTGQPPHTTERHFLSGLWFSQIKPMVSTAVEAGGGARCPHLKKRRCLRKTMELLPACLSSSDPARVSAAWWQGCFTCRWGPTAVLPLPAPQWDCPCLTFRRLCSILHTSAVETRTLYRTWSSPCQCREANCLAFFQTMKLKMFFRLLKSIKMFNKKKSSKCYSSFLHKNREEIVFSSLS